MRDLKMRKPFFLILNFYNTRGNSINKKNVMVTSYFHNICTANRRELILIETGCICKIFTSAVKYNPWSSWLASVMDKSII